MRPLWVLTDDARLRARWQLPSRRSGAQPGRPRPGAWMWGNVRLAPTRAGHFSHPPHTRARANYPPRPPPRRTHVCMCMCMHMYMDMYTWSMYISPSATTTSHACMHVCACTHIVLTDPAPRPPPPLARRPSTADPPAAPSRPSPATSSSHHTATLAATRPLCRRLHLPALP